MIVITGREEFANRTFNFFILLFSGPDPIHNCNVHIWKCSSVDAAFVTEVRGFILLRFFLKNVQNDFFCH